MTEQTVKVIVRIRPYLQKEINPKKQQDIYVCDHKQKQITLRANNNKYEKVFTFDEIFTPDSSQQDVFSATGYKLVYDVMQGYNGTIFAYGQTGSGKTHTMMGKKDDRGRGITPRCFQMVLEQAKGNSKKQFLVMCSFIEIYNEQIRDLLSNNTKTKLQIRQSAQKGIFIKDLKKVPVTTCQEMEKCLQIGNQNRSTGQTLMNSQSSRSHSIFTIYVESLEKNQGMEKLIGSKFNLVDLAGSERQGKTGSTGQRFLQATKINLSLTALGKVISTLVQGKVNHIPYRDSKLTRLLQDSLGGNAKTIMIATISPAAYNFDETVGTLKYASRAKYITNAPKINQDPKDALLRQYQFEITRLRVQLRGLQEGDRPSMDRLMSQKQKITKQAQQEKKQLIQKIKQLQQQLISPSQLSQKLLNERDRRQQKLSFMQRNYKNLQEEVRQMRELLTELRRKYKNASKEIFQLQNEHQRQKQQIQEEFIKIKKETIMYKSVLNVLFTQKQLNNIVSLGCWENQKQFKLPLFYFKDRHTLAFPCSTADDNSQQTISDKQRKYNDVRDNNYMTATSAFRGLSQSKQATHKKRVPH